MIEFDQSKTRQRRNNRISSRLRQILAWELAAVFILLTSMLIVGAVLVSDYDRSIDEYVQWPTQVTQPRQIARVGRVKRRAEADQASVPQAGSIAQMIGSISRMQPRQYHPESLTV